MSKPQNTVTFNNKQFTITPELRNAIEIEQKIQASKVASAEKRAKEAIKAMTNEIVSVETILMKMQAKINENDEFTSVEVIPHTSIKDDINKLLDAQLKCAQLVMKKHAMKKMKIIEEVTGLSFSENTEAA